MKKKYQKLVPFVLVATFILNIYVWVEYIKKPDENLHFYTFDVGQGDAHFIKTPYGQDVLIDGGLGKEVLGELGKAMPFYDRHIDLIILTHPHLDHIEGLINVLERYNVGKVMLTGVNYESAEYEEFLELIEDKGIPVEIANRGQEIVFSEDLKLDILAPENMNGEDIVNLNISSVVGVLDFGNFEIFLPGDMEIEGWEQILKSEKDLNVEVLKMSHHGSENGTTKEILSKLQPEIAVISVGENNKYGHPGKGVLELLDNLAVKILRTDRKGTIHIVSDGESYQIK